MHINFIDEDDDVVATIVLETDDEWEACEMCHNYLTNGVIRGATDFSILRE